MRLAGFLTRGQFGSVWWACAALFVLSPLFAAGSLRSSALLSMLPFAAVLALACMGQTLVVQQRGLDLSVPGGMALGAVLVTKIPEGHPSRWPIALAVALLATGLAGGITGLVVTRLHITPIVATLVMNAVLLGVVLRVSKGSPAQAADDLSRLALDKTLGIPNTVIVAGLVIGVVAFTLRRTTIGHRLAAAGVSRRAARTMGVPVDRYQVMAYAIAGASYGAAGILLAAYIKTPPIFLGDSYLLPTVASVVLGGTSLAGGVASVVASGAAALFFTQLNQVLLARGLPTAGQLLVQSGILVLVVASREGVAHLRSRSRRSRSDRPETPLDTVDHSVAAAVKQ
jgi:ribose transport system permease protein